LNDTRRCLSILVGLRHRLLHRLTDVFEVIVCGLRRHQVLGAAVFAFEHGVDHAELAQLVQLAVDGGRRGNGGQCHGISHCQWFLLFMAHGNEFQQFLRVQIHGRRVFPSLQGMEEIEKTHVNLFGFHGLAMRFKTEEKVPRLYTAQPFLDV